MPLNYIPISSDAGLKSAVSQINRSFQQIAAENQSRTIMQGAGIAIQTGKLSNGTYGIVLSDPTNTPRIYIGFRTNGKPVIAITKVKNVIEALNGTINQNDFIFIQT